MTITILTAALLFVVVVAGVLFFKLQNSAVTCIALLAYMEDNGGAPSYDDLESYVRWAFENGGPIYWR